MYKEASCCCWQLWWRAKVYLKMWVWSPWRRTAAGRASTRTGGWPRSPPGSRRRSWGGRRHTAPPAAGWTRSEPTGDTRNHGMDTFYLGFKTFVNWVYSNRNRWAAVITIVDKQMGFKICFNLILSYLFQIKILYCRLIIFWYLKQKNWNIESTQSKTFIYWQVEI